MLARHAKALILLSLSVLVGVSLLTSVAGATQSAWAPVGDEMEVDLPAGFGNFKDVRKDRPGVQTNVRVLRNASERKLRFAASDGVVAEAADGGFRAKDSLGAGWRAVAWGDDASGKARLWTPAFDSGRTFLSTDPALPCGKALDRTTPLAGPFSISIPAGARPGGNTIASPASVFVYGDLRDPDRGVRVATAGGVKIGERKNRPIARGAFLFANAVFVYGTNGRGNPRLLTPELVGKSTALVATSFVPCKPASPQGTITVTKKLVPADDSGRFDLLVDGTVKKAGAGDGGTTGAVSVPAGSHSISETASAGGTLVDYTTAIDCVGTNEAGPLTSSTTSLQDIPVEAGDDWQCTITNTRKPPFDGNVAPVKDEAHAASAAIGPAGGTITASGMTLSVPAGALHDQQTITLTPLSSIGGSPFHDLIGAVQMEPEGLHFLIPATLTIPRPAGLLDSQIVGFGFTGGGTGFHLKPKDISSGPIVLQVLHFSGGGAANATLTEVNRTLGYEPTPAQELAEQQIAAAQNQFPNPSDQLIPTFNALKDWFDHSVYTGLQVVGDSLDNLELALGEWVAWVGEVESFRKNFDLPNAFSQDLALGQRSAADDAAHIADLVLAGCTGAGANPLASLRPVVRLSADLQAIEQARAIRLTIENTITPAGRRLPPATALPFSCLHVKIEGITHAPKLAFLHDNSYKADVGVVFWNAPDPNHSIPVVLTLLDQTEVVIPPTTVTDGHLKTTVKPTLFGNRAYVLQAELEAAAADDTLKALSDQQADTTPVRARIELQSDATIKPGENVHLKALLAGDGMVNGTVTYTIDGTGTLSVSSGITDADGETGVDYTAPPDNHPSVARITASFDDGTGPVEGLAKITVKPDVHVLVGPPTIQLPTGGTTQFTALITGVNDTSVTWSKTGGGTIDQTGFYTAPQTPGTFTVTATSNEDPTAKDSATVTVVSSGTVTVTFRAQNALASGDARAARLDGTADAHVLGVDDPHLGLGSFTSNADPGAQNATGDGGAIALATAHAVVQADVFVANGRLSATVGTISVDVTTQQTQGSAIDPELGCCVTLDARATAEATAALTVDFTVSGQAVPFACFGGGDARVELRSNGQRVFLGSAQATLVPGSYELTVGMGATAASLPPKIDTGGRPPSDHKSGSAACE